MFIAACEVDNCLTCDTSAAMCDACEAGFVRISATECRGNSQTYRTPPPPPHTHTDLTD